MLLLLEDKGLRETMGEAGRKTVEEKYSEDMIGKKVMNVYQEVFECKSVF